MGYLWLEARSPKSIKSRGIGSQPSRTPFHELHQQPLNQNRFRGFSREKSPSKEAQGPHMWHPTIIPQRNAFKMSPWKTPRKAPKITKKGKCERHSKTIRNHVESSIHTMKVHTRSRLPPNHPSVTPVFPKKTKCKPICMPGSSFMHIVT
jgi:hypothetical protein